MNIQVGEIYMDKVTKQKTLYPNKTRKYLLPCLREYGDIFISKLNDVFKVAIGIGDIVVDNCGYRHEKHLFLLLDSKIAGEFFTPFLEWIREQPMYEDDYVYGNVQKSTFHMIIIRFPEKFWDSFETFKIGSYSTMYDEKTIKDFFHHHPDIRKVLIKDSDYRLTFIKRLNKKFNTELTPTEWDGELDFPPTEIMEVFNHHLKH